MWWILLALLALWCVLLSVLCAVIWSEQRRFEAQQDLLHRTTLDHGERVRAVETAINEWEVDNP